MRFGVHARDRLRSRLADQNPRTVLQKQLDAVHAVDRGDLAPGAASREATARRAFRASLLLGRQQAGRVGSCRKGPISRSQVGGAAARCVLPGRADHLGREEVRQDPVLLRDVALDRQARALLRPEDDLARDQLLADVLEADRRLVERHAELLRDRVERVRRRDAAGDAAAAALAAEQVPEQERQDLGWA